MPELPDVESFRRVLNTCCRGRRVRRVEVRDAGVLRGVTAKRLRREVEGQRLGRPRRHGKLLVVPIGDGPALVWHFGMTGELLSASADDPPATHDRVVLTFDDERQLRYRDQRKLQGIRLSPNPRTLERLLDELGPDALDMTRPDFLDLLTRHRGAVKGVLMDQSLIAGLGNLLSDEILWRARVAPRRPARDLDDAEARHIFTAMRRVLATATRDGCVPPRRTWLTGRRDDAEPECPRCGARLRSSRVSGRRTVWCENCQH
ncbi:DNA-formamidopyrimidine glycosylase family protein [Streptomyces sp. FXJ1.172]|uniref:Fpg/Nei family DNA glycosylase n=1 Tax=Streptomyces sp. FXJ1.172 TaxID=710705 RepID=UPI0007CFA27E|nr:DNA-formamidopyrimidine glycosylase family protein [Streptomyces sp. FXJ1.172]WEO99658.1 formamidopyrimidine-DNA glycosylase [Streptomyces sp. FXJ1.172]